ncbi:MAG: DNA primase [Bacilli bacterium]
MNTSYQINEDKINEIRRSVDIVDVISEYISLVSKGKNFFGVCPFHADHSPSMSVSSEKQIYRCFSCGASGNVYKFLMDYENITFLESLKIVANKGGIELNVSSYSINKSNKNSKLFEIYDISQKFYQNNINSKEGILAKSYLNERGINTEIIKEFGIGLSIKDTTFLTNLLLKKEFDEKDIIKTGLINRGDKGLHDVYYNRIMFPLYDTSGNIIGYSGRIYNQTDSAKYINTKETEIFKKGELLYNYHKAKEYARVKNQIIIMEGFMDVIRAYTVGIKNVVASMGTAITKEQILLLKKLSKDVILCFDGDEAGAKATFTCADELIKVGINPKIIKLEENLDPDEYILKYGKDKFLLKLENTINIMDFKLSYLKNKKNLTNSVEQANYIHEVINEISKIEDEILREITIKKLSDETKISILILKSKLDDQLNKKEINIEIKEQPIFKMDKYGKAEVNLVYYMLNNNDVVNMFNKQFPYLPTFKYRTLAKEISVFYKKNKFINTADILTLLRNDEEEYNTVIEISNMNLKDEYSLEQIQDYIDALNEYSKKNEIIRLKQLMSLEIDPIKKAEIQLKIVELKKTESKIEE